MAGLPHSYNTIKSATSSGYSTPSFISTNNNETEGKDCDAEVPPSFVYDTISIDPEILYQTTSVPNFNIIKMVDFTGVHNIFEPNYLIVTTS